MSTKKKQKVMATTKTYKIHPRHADKPELITYVNGRAVNLTGKPAQKQHPATASAGAWTEQIAAATQEDLKAVFLSGAKDREGYLIVIEIESETK